MPSKKDNNRRTSTRENSRRTPTRETYSERMRRERMEDKNNRSQAAQKKKIEHTRTKHQTQKNSSKQNHKRDHYDERSYNNARNAHDKEKYYEERRKRAEQRKEHQRQLKKQKRRRIWKKLYTFTILVLTIANVSLASLIITYVQEFDVTGIKFGDKNKIVKEFKKDPLAKNSIYTWWKVKSGAYTKPVYLEEMKLKFLAPWNIRLQVTEKAVMAGALLEDAIFEGESAEKCYVYFDKEGLVMAVEAEPIEGITLIEGMDLIEEMDLNEGVLLTPGTEVKKFEKLKVEDEKVFSYIENMIKSLENNELSPDKIMWEQDSMNVQFGDICVKLGKHSYDIKLPQIAPILSSEALIGKVGILHLEHYDKTSNSISFEITNLEESTDENDSSTDDLNETVSNETSNDNANETAEDNTSGETSSNNTGSDDASSDSQNPDVGVFEDDFDESYVGEIELEEPADENETEGTSQEE